ncbi:MAG: aldehyde-activating protein [Burkholderiales bacterium PBB4]|nr:MAG: aldehyde-activating protein [Burkholderiales bacterium PBB4]
MLKGSCHCGGVHWQFKLMPESVTACNCTVCRRYGVLWAYDYQDENITVAGDTQAYVWGDATLGFHFCPTCGCVAYWRALQTDAEGRRRIAVNVRLSEPDAVAHLPIDHFDGLVKFDDIGRDGRCVADVWF